MEEGTKMPRGWAAFFLGLVSLALFFFFAEVLMSIGKIAGLVVTLILMGAYFFICQFRLSRGDPDALRKDWPIMLALDAVPLLVVFSMVLVEKWPVILSQGLGILLVCCGGTFAGAFAASRAARRTTARR